MKVLKKILSKISRSLKKKSQSFFVHSTAIVEDESTIQFGKDAEVWEYVIIRKGVRMTVGESTQIGPFSVLFGGNNISIGKNVIIAPHCVIAAGNHDYKQSTLPMRFARSISEGPIIIEDNVWIGANCTITDNVRIGKDAVVAANSVVTKNVEPYSIVGGTPAKKIGQRKI